ncbi:MAG: ATP-binding protein, partial [Acidobacteriota bacterium]
PHLLHWVPWEAFIAYGDALASERQEGTGEKVAEVIAGRPYLERMRERFPKGLPRKRTEITLGRQNKDPRTQGVLEAVSNSIDAISEREKIGQFGLGVKQVFEWFEEGAGEVSVSTHSNSGEPLALHAKKGYDGQVYVKFFPPTAEEMEALSENATGTCLRISGIAVNEDKQRDLAAKMQERFRYVPETSVLINGEKINGHEAITVVGRTEPVSPRGEIAVTIANNEIKIVDNGSGMDEQSLFRMFLPGHGKGYQPLSSVEAEHMARDQAEVLLIEDETPRIVLSRNREAVVSFVLPQERINTSSKTICLEMGRILNVSEGRDGVAIDDNFASAVAILVQKTLEDKTLTDNDKTTFLNSVTLGIDQLSGITDAAQEDKTAVIARKTKHGIRNVAKPYLQNLRNKDVTLLPNYTDYQRVKADAQFVDPYLLEGVADLSSLLQSEGFGRLRSENGIVTKAGWQVLTGEITPGMSAAEIADHIQTQEGLQGVRKQISEIVPVVMDREHRIVIVDSTLWKAVAQE